MLTPLQLPSIHHNTSCEENTKREFGQQNAAKERLKRHLEQRAPTTGGELSQYCCVRVTVGDLEQA